MGEKKTITSNSIAEKFREIDFNRKKSFLEILDNFFREINLPKNSPAFSTKQSYIFQA